MSIKLTDTQLVMLSAAAQRNDHCLVAGPRRYQRFQTPLWANGRSYVAANGAVYAFVY